MRSLLPVLLFSAFLQVAGAQPVSSTFELRGFSTDPAANGETDFKGPTEVFDTEQRVAFLNTYADYGRRFFDDPDLNTEVVTRADVRDALRRIKPQPLPSVRRRIRLDEWKRLGEPVEPRGVEPFTPPPGTEIVRKAGNSALTFTAPATARWTFPSQVWRGRLTWRAMPSPEGETLYRLSDRAMIPVASVGFGADGRLFYTTAGKRETGPAYEPGAWHTFEVDIDFGQPSRTEVVRYNLFVNGRLVADYVPMERVVTGGPGYASVFNTVGKLNTFTVEGAQGAMLDDLLVTNYLLTGRESYPFTPETVVDESFEPIPEPAGWTSDGYRDSLWTRTALPAAHGSERHAGEALLLRTSINVGPFERAIWNVEAVYPEATLYVNGREVAVLRGMRPAEVDVTAYLEPDADNLLAVKVHPFYLVEGVGEIMPHAFLDFNVGWFAGRMSLDLTDRAHIDDVFAYTTALPTTPTGSATLHVRINTESREYLSTRGELVIEVTPWFPEEAARPAVVKRIPATLGRGEQTFETTVEVPRPNLWTTADPHLYSVRVVLEEEGAPIDDEIITTGIRTVSQEGGTFRINGRPSMLNGASLMGHRGPVDSLAVNLWSPPTEILVQEILQAKAGGGNHLRVHVHNWEFPSGNINDPRFPELADQLGLMFIWGTPAWVRTGWGWGQIDFESLPYYIRQVRNHPSIVMWEVANHTQSFKGRDPEESNLYVQTAYDTVMPADPSRLISYNSFVYHFHYGNDAGTITQDGKPMTPAPAWTAPNAVRGNQDSPTGYGKTWNEIRTWPDAFRQSFLDSPTHAYFNFEHEESIAQPNWTLVKGKPWYRMQSYEWDYDTGSIGRRLTADEWRASQGWQAFSGWEATKKQRLLDYDGFTWINLHGGANTMTYKKPYLDALGHAKLNFWVQKALYREVVAGSADVDVVYGPSDRITPAVMHLGDARTVDLTVTVKTPEGNAVEERRYPGIRLPAGRGSVLLDSWRPTVPSPGIYAVEYTVRER